MINKMLEVINHCRKLNYNTYHTKKTISGELRFVEANVNIVYVLNNKVYVGYGMVKKLESNIKRTLTNIQREHSIIYKSVHYVTSLKSNELGMFMDLLRHEQEMWGNIKISTSYAEWIRNDLPCKVASANEGAYWKYEVDGISFVTDKKVIDVNVCLDNCDVEQFFDYLIGECSMEIIDDLSSLGNFEGVVDVCGDLFRVVEI